MKVYVDLDIRDIKGCPCFNDEYNMCQVDKNGDLVKCTGKNSKECPLQSLSDYTKQARKEIIENLKQEIIYYPVGLLGIDGQPHKNTWGISKEILESYFEKILDYIEQGDTDAKD